jgi:uncharacterized protein (DUF1800 family)
MRKSKALLQLTPLCWIENLMKIATRTIATRILSKIGSVSLLVLSVSVSSNAIASQSSKTLHALNRLSLGIRPGEIETVESMGIERYIQTQLSPQQIPLPTALAQRLAQLDTLQMKPIQLRQVYRQPRKEATPEARKAHQQGLRTVRQQAVQARLLRATESPRQLEEVMVEFWFNHFNVFANKGLDRLWVGSYEETAIRPHVFGKFRTLLEATARHPAMLFYLDNWQNTAPGSAGARGRLQGLNENYARELMELHTLGVNGGYTQADVTTLAKILTGWGIERGNQERENRGRGNQIGTASGFYFDAKRHDFSDKVFLGRPIKGTGEAEVEQALDMLAKSPETAQHLSYELAQYFVADRPPATLVNQLTQRYLETDGDIRAVLETLLHSREFWNPKVYGTKFKTPYQYTISAFRATGTDVQDGRLAAGILQQLGMPLYGCQTPDGYKNTQAAWLNPDSVTRRLSFVTALTKANPLDAAQLSRTLGSNFSAQTTAALATSPSQLRPALILGSPEFMYR